ncbi:MAG: DUF1501 domain-containing protein [Planctomycetes bacterium]|nr:DUF1501 domain-containing protein [Planctomycetota bacterium]
MLTLSNGTRRDFLRVGALGFGGLTLPDLLRLRAESGSSRSPRAVIMVCLAGGPSHMDMYDLKPNAPDDYRGEFKPTKTNVPGFDICEHMPLQTKIADKLALVRSLQFVEPLQHELEEVFTGFPKAARRPSFGSVVSKFSNGDPKLPSYVSLEYGTTTTSYESPQYIGAAHRPLQLVGTSAVRNLSLIQGVTPAKLTARQDLLGQFDTFRRDLDTKREAADMDAFSARALDMITSSKAREAFDLSKEPEKVRAKYGARDDKYTYVGTKSDSVWDSEKFLLARRLVEAGVPVVTLRMGQWDHHGNVIQQVGGVSIWHSLKTVLPLLDRSIHALVSDLHDRGLDKEVLVVVWGEFGRTPKISLRGRDHWPDASFALFAGAVKTGQVIGQTDSRGERPKTRALGAQNVLGTIYHTLGIDWKQKVLDFGGRPMQLLDDGEPISELVE